MSNQTNIRLTLACRSSIDAALHQLTEAKVNKQTNNNNMSTNNKQTNKGSAHAGAVWNCAMTEFSAQCIRVCRRAPETYQRYIGENMKVDSTGCTLTDSMLFQCISDVSPKLFHVL